MLQLLLVQVLCVSCIRYQSPPGLYHPLFLVNDSELQVVYGCKVS
jgi:hypothetical protein